MFLVWDTIDKKWLTDGTYDYLAIGIDGSVFRCHTESCESPIKEIYNPVVILRSTGGRSKDGRQIFEEDICKAHLVTDKGLTCKQGRIIMHEYMWCLDSVDEEGNRKVYPMNFFNDFEIIGNTYSNNN
jgi:hypothetical protein